MTAVRRISGNDSRAVAVAIRDRIPFETYGSLRAGDLKHWGEGRLNEKETKLFREQYVDISYAVYSYATPIAWVLKDGSTHRVDQKFSVTTTKHQSKLYLLEGD